MPKDYRKRKKSRTYKSNTHNGLIWAVFGILIGLFLAIVFSWHQPKSSDDQHHVTVAKTAAMAAHSEHPVASVKKPAVSAAPEFDFYTVLPKMQVTPTNPTQVATPAKRPPTAPPPSTTVPATPIPAADSAMPELAAAPSPVSSTEVTSPLLVVAPMDTTSALPPTSIPAASEKKIPETQSAESAHYLLQMASLKNYADADRLKAQLMMLGFDVSIQSYNAANGQIYNRVVMGPYASRTAASQQQVQLQKNHVPSILIKAP